MAHLQATQTKVIILLGPPGAGKGSQAALIKEKVGLAHISTGDLLRDNIKQGTDLGKQAKGYMDQGKLVPDDLIFGMLFTRVSLPDCRKGYILDGFPRNSSQADALQSRLKDHQVCAINFSLPDEIIIKRITQREICKKCQAPYHRVLVPPKVEGVCDLCNGELHHRADDTEEIVKERLKIYHEKTAPLIEYYREQNTLHSINSNQSKKAILLEVLTVLGEGQ